MGYHQSEISLRPSKYQNAARIKYSNIYSLYLDMSNLKNKIMKKMNFQPDENDQISTFLMDNLKPIGMKEHWGYELKIEHYIKPMIKTIELIMELGDIEHTSDWDPSILITFYDGKKLETEPGYYIMDIQNQNLLLEDAKGIGRETNENDSYHLIPIDDIQSIQLLRN